MRFQRHVVPPFPGLDALGIFALDHREADVAEEHTQRGFGGVDDSEQRGGSRFGIAVPGCGAEAGERGARGVIRGQLLRAMRRCGAKFGRETAGLDDRDFYAEALHFGCQRLAEAFEAPFGGVVEPARRHRPNAADG